MLDRRINQEELGASAEAVLDIYLLLQLLPGHLLLPLLVLTFTLSRTAVRHATLVNVVVLFMLTDIVSCFLLYAGQTLGPEPSTALCTAQLSLLNGLSAAWPVAIGMLVLNMWGTFTNSDRIMKNQAIKTGMIVSPYIVTLAFALPAAVLAAQMPDRVSRDRRFFYCSLDYLPYSTAQEIFSALACLIALAFQIRLVLILARNRHVLHRAGVESGVDLKLIVRVLIFGTYIAAGFIISFLMLWSPRSVVPDMFAASIGLVLFFIFGTQRDVLRMWCFWRTTPPPVPAKTVRPDLVADDANDGDLKGAALA